MSEARKGFQCETFAVQCEHTREYARHDSGGQHDKRVTLDAAAAKSFPTWGEASEFNQNFDDSWYVVEIAR